MKKIILSSIAAILLVFSVTAQETVVPEKYGKTLNGGVGVGYYGYIGHATPVLYANFEFDVAKNLTLAPFIACYSYNNNYYWGNPHYSYRDYSYHQTVIPVGIKGTYYFDELLKAHTDWDFYLAGSVGLAFRKTTWENGYYGETNAVNGAPVLFIDVHAGAEYHMNQKLGLFLDLSTGISTFGLAVHF
jgi:hypothetical protein